MCHVYASLGELRSDPDNHPTPVLSNPLGSTANQVRAQGKPIVISIIAHYVAIICRKTTGDYKGLGVKSEKVQRAEHSKF